MPRRREVPKRKILQDPKYADVIVTKFMAVVMVEGKKAVAEQIVYGAFDVVVDRTREDPLKIFHRAIENCKPRVEVKSRRVGGATYQVPVEVKPNRQMALAMRWLVQYARGPPGKAIADKTAHEVVQRAAHEGH